MDLELLRSLPCLGLVRSSFFTCEREQEEERRKREEKRERLAVRSVLESKVWNALLFSRKKRPLLRTYVRSFHASSLHQKARHTFFPGIFLPLPFSLLFFRHHFLLRASRGDRLCGQILGTFCPALETVVGQIWRLWWQASIINIRIAMQAPQPAATLPLSPTLPSGGRGNNIK